MRITYENKNKIENLHLHDFNIIEFTYDDLKKCINIKAISSYPKKEIQFIFQNIIFCEITGEKYKGGIDIIDWYELEELEQFSEGYSNIKPVGIALVKASMDTIKIYCESIEVEETDLKT